MEGLDRLQNDIKELLARFPDETKKKMKAIGKEFTKDCNALMPSGYKNGKRAIPKSWKVTVDEEQYAASKVYIQNTAPHFHLVEKGHKKWINGVDTGGTVAGKHYVQRIVGQYEDDYPDKIEQFLEQMLRGSGL